MNHDTIVGRSLCECLSKGNCLYESLGFLLILPLYNLFVVVISRATLFTAVTKETWLFNKRHFQHHSSRLLFYLDMFYLV